MGSEWETRFDEFKEFIRNLAQQSQMGIDCTKSQEDQEEAKWEAFVKRLINEFPRLEDFQDQWPAQVYFNRWVNDRTHRLNQREEVPSYSAKETSPYVEEEDSNSDDEPLLIASLRCRGSTARKRGADADGETEKGPSKRRTRSSTTSNGVAAPGMLETPKKVFYIGIDPSNFKRPSGKATSPPQASAVVFSDDESDNDLPTSNKHHTVDPSQMSVTGSPAHHSPVPSTDGLPNWCVWCGRAPNVKDCFTEELRKMFPPDLLGILASLGILHDLHLHILASKVDNSRRQRFFSTFVPSKFTLFGAHEINAKIDRYGGHHLPGGYIEVCPRHETRHAVDVPSELSNTLQILGMEELGPAICWLGIDSNASFRTVRESDPDAKRMIFSNVKEIKLSPFQSLMLEFAFEAPV
ncbi:hypothetical protein B0H11DRAFT_2269594 [Mycena galericulata]|nr:hypothetical protein B0H11DRAFT_2269594 [Mycena galericulata]